MALSNDAGTSLGCCVAGEGHGLAGDSRGLSAGRISSGKLPAGKIPAMEMTQCFQQTKPQAVAWRLVATVVALAVIAISACASPQPRKRTFVGLGSSVRTNVSEPSGLNPLGALNTCEYASQAHQTERVLVSRPEYFTEDASRMIVALREALAENREARELLELELSRGPIQSQQEAVGEGRRCGALIVLWEQRRSRTLELTLPNPAKVPLRTQVKENLCEFGGHSEQVTILYYTIIGLTAMVNHDYADAKYYLDAANRIDVDCLHIPLADQGERGRPAALKQCEDASTQRGHSIGRQVHRPPVWLAWR